ncbi:MAG TPA: LamG domain-containing protein [bacterium]|nr:LamG domain-containing protein [bacterium]HOL67153.1 LamG domain-containing protein [bacterium]HPP11920.1 LamG domain-containing protein [bacterium]
MPTKRGVAVFLGAMILFSAGAAWSQEKDSAGQARKKLLSDKTLLFYAPFDFSVDAETAYHHKTGQLYGEAQYVKGVVGNCLWLPAEGKGSVGYPMSDNIDLDRGTLMFWFKPGWWGDEETGKYTLLWVSMKDANKYFAFHRSFSPKYPTLLYISRSWQGGTSLHTDQHFKKDTWMHLAATWDAAANKFLLYINGEVKATGTWSAVDKDPALQPNRMSLGRYYTADTPINSAYDEFYVFKRVLTPEEIAAYWKETRPVE